MVRLIEGGVSVMFNSDTWCRLMTWRLPAEELPSDSSEGEMVKEMLCLIST